MAYGKLDNSGIWFLDEPKILNEIQEKTKPYHLCPGFPLQKVLSRIKKLPDTINTNSNNKWFYINNDMTHPENSDEINEHYHHKQSKDDENNTIVKGTKWNLSNSHENHDICNVYATQDLYGLGPGVYPSDKIPNRHKGCKCFLTSVLYKGDELINKLKDKYKKIDEDIIPRKHLTETTQTSSGCLVTIIILILLFVTISIII